MYDYCIVGGGIVGLATALAIMEREPAAGILLLEKEDEVGAHQTGHNSGVIHAGIYYAPGSLKARLCRAGEAATKAFCEEHGIDYRTPGKLVVATGLQEKARLDALERNATANGIDVRRIDQAELRELEPEITGLSALLVKTSGIVDYRRVAKEMKRVIARAGGTVLHGVQVERIDEMAESVRVVASDNEWRCRKAIACAGLQADRLAERSGMDVDFRIVPFRGEYYAIKPEKTNIVSHLIYPVPDPSLPFLGIHLTPMIDGKLTVGPNAVLGFAREGYGKGAFRIGDVVDFMTFPGFWKVVANNLKSGIEEAKDSIFKQSYLDKCRKYCPSLALEDLQPYRAGIRAQAVTREGALIHDFSFLQTEKVLHVCNAPSPAATSAIPIGKMIFDRLRST